MRFFFIWFGRARCYIGWEYCGIHIWPRRERNCISKERFSSNVSGNALEIYFKVITRTYKRMNAACRYETFLLRTLIQKCCLLSRFYRFHPGSMIQIFASYLYQRERWEKMVSIQNRSNHCNPLCYWLCFRLRSNSHAITLRSSSAINPSCLFDTSVRPKFFYPNEQHR